MAGRVVQRGSSFQTYVDIFTEDCQQVEMTEKREQKLQSSVKDDEWTLISQQECDGSGDIGTEEGTQAGTPDSARPVHGTNRAPQKLCGFLNKCNSGALGIKKSSCSSKKRWFVFADNVCMLLYYRTPDDMVPLGEIDVAHASFSFDVGESSKGAKFEIRSNGKHCILEATDNNTRQYWLQELQKKRREYSRMKTKVTLKKSYPDTSYPVQGGLVHGDIVDFSISSDHASQLLGSVECPPDTVGEASAALGHKAKMRKQRNQSFSNWKTELRNIMTNFNPRHAEDPPEETPTSPVQNQQKSSVFYGQETDAVFEENPRSMSVSQHVSGKLANLKDKLTRPKSLRADNTQSRLGTVCQRCKVLEESLQNKTEDMNCLDEELQATRAVVRVLQKHIDKQQLEIESRAEMDSTQKADFNMMKEKDSHIVDLKHFLATLQEEFEMSKVEMKSLQSVNTTLTVQLDMYKDSLLEKDKTIVSLTERLSQLEGDTQPVDEGNEETSCKTGTMLPADMEISLLKDKQRAYEIQFKFLNREISELNQLRKDEDDRERKLLGRLAEAEARFLQIKSKHLLCLRDLSAPIRDGETNTQTQEMVAQLLEEAMDSENNQDPSNHHYDKYGFALENRGNEDLETQADSLQKRSNELTSKAKSVERDISNVVKWETYIVCLGERPLHCCPELKGLIRAGVPTQHRPLVWKFCVGLRIQHIQTHLGANHYQRLLAEVRKSSGLNPAAHQVELDLLRTLPNNKHYECNTSEGTLKLRNVLLAYTQHNPEIGYCQGLNRLAAIALLFLEEEDAFWCLVAIVEQIMPRDYYNNALVAAHTDMRVLKDILTEKLPHTVQHIEQNGIELSLYAFNWFMTIFVDNVPVELYLRIWDTFLYEGNKVLFRFAVALLKYRENEILDIKDTLSLLRYLQNIAETVTDVNRVIQIAFNEVNPFGMKAIQQKRSIHKQAVMIELDKINILRQSVRRGNSCEQEIQDSDDEL